MSSLLLADDSPTIAKILNLALKSESYTIRSALTAAAALAELTSNPPDIFLVDLTLPEKNGYEFAKLIRSNPALAKVRVILLSSAFDPIDPKEFAACGADDSIEKPFDPEQLRGVLTKVLSLPKHTNLPEMESGFSSDSGFLQHDPNDILASLIEKNSDSSFESPLGEPQGNESSNPSILLDPFAVNIPGDSSQIPSIQLGSEFSLDHEPTTQLEKFEPSNKEKIEPSTLPQNAALSAFLEAEIEPAPMEASHSNKEDAFESSLSSIDWDIPSGSNLNSWSQTKTLEETKKSTQPIQENQRDLKKNISAPPASEQRTTSSQDKNLAGQRSKSQNASAGIKPDYTDSLGLFDTGGSSFRFADDYIQRITRAFTGDLHEQVPAMHPPKGAHAENPEKHDSPAPQSEAISTRGSITSLRAGGGAWTAEETKKIEGLVREEVQMVVREIVEKIAWEVIPELAENLIKRELEKVLKELEE